MRRLHSVFSLLVWEELIRATGMHGSMASSHEAYAIILEEVDEFWALIKSNKAGGLDALRELVHIAAMCERAALDLQLIAHAPERVIDAT